MYDGKATESAVASAWNQEYKKDHAHDWERWQEQHSHHDDAARHAAATQIQRIHRGNSARQLVKLKQASSNQEMAHGVHHMSLPGQASPRLRLTSHADHHDSHGHPGHGDPT